MINRAWPAHVMLQLVGKLRLKVRIIAIVFVLAAQLLKSSDQCFSYKDAAVGAKVATLIRKVINFHYVELLA